MTDFLAADASQLDAADPLACFRDRFHIPPGPDGQPCVYLVGNSLGCQPKAVREHLEQELDDWTQFGVEGHFKARSPWVKYTEQFREPLGRVVGAKANEVVVMNTLTVNLHLLMVSFYRPTRERYKIVIEDTAFPSDSYAVQSQARFHGFDPKDAIVRLKPRDGEVFLRTGDIIEAIERDPAIALVMLGGVNYLTGQWFDMPAITEAGKNAGCVVGWDLAHAAGNVPMKLHDWGVDFAAWCNYKYLNSGPGAVAGAFVHEKHVDADLPRFDGWWGHEPKTRFKMTPDISPATSVDAWQISNPPVFSMTPLKASLELFDEAGMDAIRQKSIKLTGYLEQLLREQLGGVIEIRTPDQPEQRGAQLSLVVNSASPDISHQLSERGVLLDFREPNVIRAAPAPLYCSFGDMQRFVQILGDVLR